MTDLAAARAAHTNAVTALRDITRREVGGIAYVLSAIERMGMLLDAAELHMAEVAGVLADRDETGQRNVALASELGGLREFASWLIALDEPGSEERRTVTLTAIINRARVALGEVSGA